MLFFGTPSFAVPTLERLLEGPHRVVGVVTQPDRGRGRGRERSPSPVALRAQEAGLPLFRPEKVGEASVVQELERTDPDLGVVVAFGQFLPRRIRELPRLGYLINGHASLLPRHRGAAPIAHAILAGDRETGVSVMRVEREMDSGPVARVRRTEIREEETCGELTERLAGLTAEAIAETLDAIAAERVRWVEQDDSRATLAPRITRADAELHFEETALAVVRRVRAMAPRPGAFTLLAGEPLRILAARARAGPAPGPPGRVAYREGTLVIATGSGWLAPRILQRPGGRPLDVEVFLRGHPLSEGTVLGRAKGSA